MSATDPLDQHDLPATERPGYRLGGALMVLVVVAGSWALGWILVALR